MKITTTETTTVYSVEDDERPRKDNYGRWRNPCYRVVHYKRTGGHHPHESWQVESYIGNNYGKHVCDPEKPTFKRVVAKVQALLNAFEPGELESTMSKHPAGVAMATGE